MKAHKWSLKFEDQSSTNKKVPKPPSFIQAKSDSSSAVRRPAVDEETAAKLKTKKSWDVVVGVAKGIPMNLFMMWMVGNGVQIFSIMMTGMLLLNPIRGIMSFDKAFKPFEGPMVNLTFQKVAFILVQLMCLSLGLYKCQSMGLIPSTTSDWLSFLEPKLMLELPPSTISFPPTSPTSPSTPSASFLPAFIPSSSLVSSPSSSSSPSPASLMIPKKRGTKTRSVDEDQVRLAITQERRILYHAENCASQRGRRNGLANVMETQGSPRDLSFLILSPPDESLAYHLHNHHHHHSLGNHAQYRSPLMMSAGADEDDAMEDAAMDLDQNNHPQVHNLHHSTMLGRTCGQDFAAQGRMALTALPHHQFQPFPFQQDLQFESSSPSSSSSSFSSSASSSSSPSTLHKRPQLTPHKRRNSPTPGAGLVDPLFDKNPFHFHFEF